MNAHRWNTARWLKLQGVHNEVLKQLAELRCISNDHGQLANLNHCTCVLNQDMQVFEHSCHPLLQIDWLERWMLSDAGNGQQVVDHFIHAFGSADGHSNEAVCLVIELSLVFAPKQANETGYGSQRLP